MKTKYIYNLEFPAYVTELNIGDYKFRRVQNYKEAFQGMMHLVHAMGSEFERIPNYGSHQKTAIGELPENEKFPSLAWGDENFTQLKDILLLLSLFTGRHVWDWEGDSEGTPISDHRLTHYGGQLHLSVTDEWKWKSIKDGKLYSDIKKQPVWDYHRVHTGFEKTINQVLNLIGSSEWQEKYQKGYFLFIYRQAIQRQQNFIEITFLACWAIWEHLFALRNLATLGEKGVLNTGGTDKISYILEEYFLVSLTEQSKEAIKALNRTRNRIAHFGKIPDDADVQEMVMFIRLTEQLVAIILELQPSNAFNSFEALENFLNSKKIASQPHKS